MSNDFQKTFISAREFLESWDKEIYEMTNLDLFIYLMVNHLGNQLEKRFFVRQRQNSPFYLDFDNIGTLCFNLGDSFEYFLEEEQFGRYNVNYMWELDIPRDLREKEEKAAARRKKGLQHFLSEGILREQSFRVELMENVILDTLIQFYYDEMGLEIDDDEIEIIELADFVEDIMIEFIRQEGQSLLQRPAEPAIDYFEGLLESEEDYEEEKTWNDEEEENLFQEETDWDTLEHTYEELSETIQKFIDHTQCDAPENGCVAKDMEIFHEYLSKYAGVQSIDELDEEHFLEFFSVWLIQKFAQKQEMRFSGLFQTLARFITWLAHHYGIDYKRGYLHYYEQVKTEVPRVIRALNAYIDEADLFEILLAREETDSNQISGFYEIKKIRSRIYRTVDLLSIHSYDMVDSVKFNSNIYSKLKPGDILQATLVQRGNRWEVLEIQYIYPRAAGPFIE